MWNYDDYKNWLRNSLISVKTDLDFNDYDIEVLNEQDFAKRRSIQPKTITVITRFLASSLIFNAKTQPVQMLIIAEENGLAVANSIFSKFCEKYNFNVIPYGTTYVKHMYSTPVVLSNFNLIGVGLRTVLYVNTTLFVLEDVMDITDMEVVLGTTHINLTPMSTTIGYTMSGDTQPFGSGHAKTVKNFSTFVMTINVACVSNAFTQLCVDIMKGNSTGKGNETFLFNFKVGATQFANVSMKLISATITTAVNNVPSLQLSFSV